MPAAMTYDSLIDDAKTYSERPNDAALNAQLPRLLMLAENRIAADYRALDSQLVVNSALTLGSPTLAKPAYWRRTVSMHIRLPNGERVELYLRQYEYARNFWPNPMLTGQPRFYAEYNAQNFFIVPTPQLAYPLELIYNARLQPLDATNQTNWFTANSPQLLFYAIMIEVSTFLKNWDKVATWGEKYGEALASLKTEDKSRDVDRSVTVEK